MNYCTSEYVRVIDTSFILNEEGHWDAESENPWITFGFLNEERTEELCDVVIRTLGWSVRHDADTNHNPKTVVLSVSTDATHFKHWGTFQADRNTTSGTCLFSCAPIAIALYPYLSFTVSSVFAEGVENITSKPHFAKIFMYHDEVSNTPFKPPPNSIVSTLFGGDNSNDDSGSMSDSTETEVLANHLSESLSKAEKTGIRKATPVMPKEKPHARYSIAQGVAHRRKTVSFLDTELEMDTRDISEIIDQATIATEANLYVESLQNDVVASPKKKEAAENNSLHHDENARLKERVSELEMIVETLVKSVRIKEVATGGGDHTITGQALKTESLFNQNSVDNKQIVTALTDMSTTVCEAFQKVESRHASFIEGFALLAGQSPTSALEVQEMDKKERASSSSNNRRQDKGIDLISDIPVAPDLRQLRSDCNVTEIFLGQRSPISLGVDYKSPRRKTKRGRKMSRNKFIPQSISLCAEYDPSYNEMNTIVREIKNTTAKKSLKEAELKVLIEYQRTSRYQKEKNKYGTPKTMKPYDYPLQVDGINERARIITSKVDSHW